MEVRPRQTLGNPELSIQRESKVGAAGEYLIITAGTLSNFRIALLNSLK